MWWRSLLTSALHNLQVAKENYKRIMSESQTKSQTKIESSQKQEIAQ
jgi:hypothetical protein